MNLKKCNMIFFIILGIGVLRVVYANAAEMKDLENNCFYEYEDEETIRKANEDGIAVAAMISQSVSLKQKEIEILITAGDGNGKATAWGCDLTYDYVKINGDYRT